MRLRHLLTAVLAFTAGSLGLAHERQRESSTLIVPSIPNGASFDPLTRTLQVEFGIPPITLESKNFLKENLDKSAWTTNHGASVSIQEIEPDKVQVWVLETGTTEVCSEIRRPPTKLQFETEFAAFSEDPAYQILMRSYDFYRAAEAEMRKPRTVASYCITVVVSETETQHEPAAAVAAAGNPAIILLVFFFYVSLDTFLISPRFCYPSHSGNHGRSVRTRIGILI